MAFSDQLAAIKTHVVAAGAALTNPITDVAVAWPAPSGSRSVRIWYGGEDDPPGFATSVLNAQLVGETVLISAYWALSNLSTAQAAVVEQEVYDLKHEIRTRLLGDTELGGTADNLALDYATTDFVTIGGAAYRLLELSATVAYTNYPLAD